MKEYPTEKIRNLVLLGHGGTGKTSFAEAALFVSGAINRLGRVDDGTTTSDFDPDEVKRKVSINASLLPVEWKDHKINLIDAPGYADFIGDAYSGLAAADSAVIVVCAASGVQVGTELAWEMAAERGVPRAILINRLDRENANFDTTLGQVRETLSKRCVAVQLPIGSQDAFGGVVDLIDSKAYIGDKGTEAEVPADMASEVESSARRAARSRRRRRRRPARASTSKKATSRRRRSARACCWASRPATSAPVFAASSTKTIGVAHFLDAITQFFPSPADATYKTEDGKELQADPNGPLAAQVFKTTADPYVGKLTYLRVLSGTLKADSHVWNANHNVDERVGHLFIVRARARSRPSSSSPATSAPSRSSARR